MKKISAFFLSIFLMALLSCAPEEDTKTIIITPPELMSAVTCSVQAAEITADDKISLNAPQNATDATLYYEIAVGADCETPTEGSSKKYTGEITLSSAGLSPSDDNIITLKVLAVKKGFENGTWTFRWRFSDGSMPLVNDDAYLKSVSASNNEANFGFLPNVFVYDDINVPNDIEKISINYEKSNKDATVETYPASLKDIPLTAGRTTLVTFTVTSSDETTKKRYSFNIYRASKEEPPFKSTDCFLSNLSVNGDTLITTFDKNKENYEAKVANSVDTTSVTYLLSSNKAQVTTTPASLENISLTAGQTTDVSITVTAEDSSYTKTYTVSIYREPAGQLSADATLKNLSVTGGNLSFSSSTKNYEVSIPSDYSGAVSVTYEKNHIGATVTTVPVNLNNISIAPGATETVTILVTAENKVATETYTVKIKRDSVNLDNNANLSNIALSAGSLSFDKDSTSYTVDVDKSVENVTVTATTESDKAKVTYIPSQTVAPQKGGSETVTINVTAEDGTPKTYTVIVNRAGDDNPPPPPVAGDYYWTNKDGAVGTNKTISSWSDWTEAERIAQNAAYDDPRTWLGIQEVPHDVYALYAAYDDTNLYIMVELTNIVDRASFMWHDYAGGDNAWWNNRDIPLGMLFNTGKGIISTKPTVGSKNAPIWDSVDFSDTNGFDAMFYHSSKYGTFEGSHVGVGTPGFFKTTSEGNFSYDSNYCLSFNAGSTIGTSGISVKYQRKCAVSKKIYYESTPTGNRGESGQTGESLINSTTYTAVDTNDLDMSYWYTIPLSTLGIDKNYIQTKGIGIRQITTGGGSLMDCSPWDPSMVDAATEPYSKVADNTSHEKEDVDDMTSAQARVGKM